MSNMLIVQGLDYCLRPLSDKSNETDAQFATRKAAYEKDAYKVRALMLMAMDGTRALQCDGMYVTPVDIWAGLHGIYKAESRANFLQLINELSDLKMLPKESINAYVGRVTALAARLRQADKEKSEEEICVYLLKGLPPVFNTVRTVLTHSAHAGGLSLNKIWSVLINAEAEISQNKERGYYAAGRNTDNNDRNNWRNNRGRGQQRDGPDQRICHGCKKKGHIMRDCPDRKGKSNSQPSGSGGNGGSPGAGRTLAFYANGRPTTVANVALFTNTEMAGNMILDTGATSHVSNCINHFETYTEVPPGQYLHGLSSKMPIVGKGTVLLQTGLPEGENRFVKLLEVLYVPAAGACLVSIPCFLARGADYFVSSQSATITYEGATILITDRRSSNLFCSLIFSRKDGEFATMLRNEPVANAVVMEQTACPHAFRQPVASPGLMAHRKIGHASYKTLQRIARGGLVQGLEITPEQVKTAMEEPCLPCLTSKAHRMPAPPSDTRASKPLELVHSDVIGPMHIPSLNDEFYVLTLLDDYSRASQVRLLTSKADVADALQAMITVFETQTGYLVRRVRTDRGTEFNNASLRIFYDHRGIVPEFAPPYTPTSNARAERLNRTLLDRMRAALTDACLPLPLWGEAIKTINWLRNNLPVEGMDVTPCERLLGSPPDLRRLHPFGCRGVAYIGRPRKKLEQKGETGYLVGYEGNAYRLWMPDTNKVEVRRDVIFHPNDFYEGKSKLSDYVDLDIPDESEGEEEGAACEVCGSTSSTVPSKMLLCDQCNQGYHLLCLDPPLTRVPRSKTWFCSNCIDAPTVLPIVVAAEEEMPIAPLPQPAADVQLQPELRTSLRLQNQAVGLRLPCRLDEEYALKTSQISGPAVPNTLAEAKRSPNWSQWAEAMLEEIKSLLEKDTWSILPLPPGAKKIPCRWVFTLKHAPDGTIIRYKARLVAQGFRQVPGIDYFDTYAPVSGASTIRVILSHAAAKDLEIRQLDVKTAFLNGRLDEEIWITPPEGLGNIPAGQACLLHRALYGLKQSPKVWYDRLAADLGAVGFTPAVADRGLFVRHGKSETVYILIYVDDLLIIGPNDGTQQTVDFLLSTYDCHDMGNVGSYLGLQIIRDRARRSIFINQQPNARDLVARYNMRECKSRSTPLPHDAKLTKGGSEPLEDSTKFARLVGELSYLAVYTRPDLSKSVNSLAKYLSCPTIAHWHAALLIVRYLAGTTDLGILYQHSETPLHGYCDSDHAADVDTRRSTTAYTFILHGGVVSWGSLTQKTVAASTVEAEFMAISAAVKEALWMQKLLRCLGQEVMPLQIYSDSQGAIALAKGEAISARSKHIAVHYFFSRDRISRGEISLSYIKTGEMVADVLTKALTTDMHEACIKSMGMRSASG
jgi:transposase InsO family protein